MAPSISNQDLIDELLRLAGEFRKSPTQDDMREVGRYSLKPYKNTYGSWNNAKREAGLPVTEPPEPISDDELLGALRRVANELGTTPTTIQMKSFEEVPRPSTYKDRFGSWNTAVEMAGLEPNVRGGTASSRGHSEEELIAKLQDYAETMERAGPPTAREMDRRSKIDEDWPCQATFRNVVGSWARAVSMAGFDPYDQGRGPGESVRKEGVDYIPFGKNWKNRRQKAIERDGGVCQHDGCRTSLEDHADEASDEGILVHHLIPRRKFYFDDRVTIKDDANQLANLVTLCYKHHAEWEHGENRIEPNLDLPDDF